MGGAAERGQASSDIDEVSDESYMRGMRLAGGKH